MVNVAELLAAPPTVTTTLTAPFVRPDGTTAVIEPFAHAVVCATTPPNVTVLEPLVDPKRLPAMVTEVPDGPDVGDKLVILGLTANRGAAETNKKARTMIAANATRGERIQSSRTR